ncbi:hypothetical protein AX17_003243 [Amanita inopinata Kibby_2008]|nr:hypothetical protein AX17_003243 [Amanita inopinata Kibby_2008]
MKQMRELLHLPNEVRSNVEELWLASSVTHTGIPQDLFSPGMDLSKLRSLETSGYWERLHPDAVVPWHQLRHLDLSVLIPLSVCLDALRQATLLEHCKIRIAASSKTSRHQRAGTIMFPKLDLLELRFTKGRDAKPFLDLLLMPNLATLEVYSIKSRLNFDETTFVEMARRSSGMKRLKTLKIGTHALVELDTTLLRRNIPLLKYMYYLHA